MGRYIFNQSISKMTGYFGSPTYPEDQSITLNFPINTLRQRLPDFPADGTLEVSFVKGKVQKITVRPHAYIPALFEFFFQYAPPIEMITLSASQTTGYRQDISCLGDGVAVETEQFGNGTGHVSFYYNEDFVSPYTLLEEQKYFLDPQGLFSLESILNLRDPAYPTENNHEYSRLSEHLLTNAEIENVESRVLYIMHHSIYARKKLIFYNSFLQQVFQNQAWYKPLYKVAQFKKDVLPTLSRIEKENLDFLFKQFLNTQSTTKTAAPSS
jgi:hypothetical protein